MHLTLKLYKSPTLAIRLCSTKPFHVYPISSLSGHSANPPVSVSQ